MNLDFIVRIENIWGQQDFKKSEWGYINYLVGPNGSGKSQFINYLISKLEESKIKVRYLSSDRLVAWTKEQSYMSSSLSSGINLQWLPELVQSSRLKGQVHDAFVLLRDNIEIRIKVESTLSQLLNRSIVLEEIGGYIIPKVSKNKVSYSFKENESHGLKMMITMLTLLYDETYNCLVVDEPELHLHPQFQTYFLQEVRKNAGDPSLNEKKKIFVFATHSPNMVDIRTIEELKHCIIFQPSKLPKYIEQVGTDDAIRLNSLVPRMNIHHKQFFFSERPIFVEGHRDQQIFSLIQEKRNRLVGSGGTTFIDVSGKDELDLFFRLCQQLSLNCQIIVDLDCLIKGRLRETISKDERCKNYLQSQGISIDFLNAWGDIAQKLDKCIDELVKVQNITDEELKLLVQEIIANRNDIDKCRYLLMVGLSKLKNELSNALVNTKQEMSYASGKICAIIQGFKRANVYVLPNGELENYFFIQNHYNISEKNKNSSFISERDFLQQPNITEKDIESRYTDLISILDEATKGTTVDYKPLLLSYIIDFIHNIKKGVRLNEIIDETSLKNHTKVNYKSFGNILEVLEFKINGSSFTCKIRIKGFDTKQPEITFDEKTNDTALDID